MLKPRIIPCLDVKNGRVVKGINFVELRDAGDPAEQARVYDGQGADELCFLDITASHENRDTLLDVVERTADVCFMPLTVGGGVRSPDDVRKLLRAGADKVAINTAAVARPEVLSEAAERFGNQCIVIAIDAQRVRPGGAVSDPSLLPEGHPGKGPLTVQYEVHVTHGGREATGIDALEWAARAVELGAGEVLLTSMDRDGTRTGFDIELTRAVAGAVPVPVVASGGVGTLDHLVEGIRDGHASAVLAASIFHFGEFTVAETKRYLSGRGIAMRV